MFFDLIYSLDKKLIDFSLNELRNQKLIYAKQFSSVSELKKEQKLIEQLNFSLAENPKASHKKKKIYLMHLVDEKKENSINEFSKHSDFLGLICSNAKAVNLAIKSNKINFLISPVTEEKPLIDLGIAKNLRKSETTSVISFSHFNSLAPEKQSLMLKNLMSFSVVSNKAKLNSITLSCASNQNNLRSSRDLTVFSDLIGLKDSKVKAKEIFASLFSNETKVKVLD